MNESINIFTQRFNDTKIESEYLDFKWPRIWPFLKTFLFFTLLIKAFVMFEDIKLLGLKIPYISYHIFDIIVFIVFMFILSDNNKKKYHQIYLGLTWIGFMNIGAWTYHFSPFDFPPGEGVVITCIILPLTIYPFHLLNGVIAALCTSIPVMVMLIQKGMMNTDQITYLFIMPFIFILFAKVNFENRSRKDFIKSLKLDSNRKLMRQTLKRYFGEHLTEKILHNQGDLKGDNIWISISFTDISSYSTIIEHMSPEMVVKFLNEYFSAMHDVIDKYKGQIVNYIGDSVMVVFGAPKKVEDHEIMSVKCAIEMREKLEKLNRIWDETEFSRFWKNHGIEKITARTGIHTGSVIAGNIGSDRMLQYSTIGDTVNVASRLEQANKDFESDIAFSHEIYNALNQKLHSKAIFLGEIKLKGRERATKVYSV